jgi:two-component system chemotaxis sensor kinase CheA
MSELNEILKEFIVEALEGLDKLDQDLVALESSPDDSEIINRIFRVIHTIKGTSGFFELKKLESVAHAGENLLDAFRSKQINFSTEIANVLLNVVDSTREMLRCVESDGTEGTKDYSPLVEKLKALFESADSQQPTEIILPIDEPSPQPIIVMPEEEVKVAAPVKQEIIMTTEIHNEVTPTQSSTLSESALRVDVGLLDQLMNLVGELVLARNQILQFNKTQTDSSFINTTQRLNIITSELQESVMKMRMQPIANVWNKFPRIVRDIAKSCGKDVHLEMEGKETELDKTLVEAIKDPLTHIIRNSVDHGIELPDVRLSNGKSPDGKVVMKAFHEGGNVIIEIADDGAGLNYDRIRAKVLEKGLATPEQLSRLSEQEIGRFIFAPGFSTAEKVTNISGRGVGMDVVRSNIEKIGGTVDIFSKLREGTTIKIKIPLTLAIVPTLIVSCKSQRFAIPQVNLVELVRVEGDDIHNLEHIQGNKFYRLRGNLLPLVNLRQTLRMETSNQVENDSDVVNIIIVKADEQHFGIVVDEVHDTEEIVVKPLGKQLKNLREYAGATIMGDGKVALIIDVMGLAKGSSLIDEVAKNKSNIKSEIDAQGDSAASTSAYLIVSVGAERQVAVPLQLVNRLEEFPLDKVEHVSGRDVVQYRGGILPLINLPQFFGANSTANNDVCHVIVYAENDDLVGFHVNGIVDIVEDQKHIYHKEESHGVSGNAVLDEHVTELLNVTEIIKECYPSFYSKKSKEANI